MKKYKNIQERIIQIRNKMKEIESIDRNYFIDSNWKILQKELKELIKEKSRQDSGFNNNISNENQLFLDKEQKDLDEIINNLIELTEKLKNKRALLKNEFRLRNLKCSQSERIYNKYAESINILNNIRK
jgi:hypothetical protein